MKKLLRVIGLSIIVLIVTTLLSSLLVLIAYGAGWLLRLLLPLSPFESTLLVLIAGIAVGSLAWNILRLPLPFDMSPTYYDEEDDEEEEEFEDEEDILIIDPDARCPCGSGRKYKNCHGKKQ
jgi:hypothetical protein